MSVRTTGTGAADFAELLRLVRQRMAATDQRVIVGITGAPGSGKSTLATKLADAIDPDGTVAVCVPMDGFHLADVELTRLGRRQRKGAIDTFDGWGYVALLQRIRESGDHTVYAPAFERTIEQPIAGAIPVLPQHRLVVTEGNYLLDDQSPWDRVRDLLDETWYCDLADEERRSRLISRHVEFGKSPDQARRWVADVDEPNARRIIAQRSRADRIISTSSDLAQ